MDAVGNLETEALSDELFERDPLVAEFDLLGPSTHGNDALKIAGVADGTQGLGEAGDGFDGREAEIHLVHDDAGEILQSGFVLSGEIARGEIDDVYGA